MIPANGKEPTMTRVRLIVAVASCFLAVAAMSAFALAQENHQPGAAVDPVCGMTVDPGHAKYTSVFNGRTYYFCSEACKKTFDRSPEKYSGKTGQAALEELAAAYGRNTGDIAVARKYGDGLIKGGKFAEARGVFEKVLKDSQDPEAVADARFQFGYIAMKERKYDEALKNWAVVRAEFPKTERVSGATVNTAAILYQIQDKMKEALEVLNDGFARGLIRAGEHENTAHKLLLMITFDTGDFVKAKEYLEKLPDEMRKDEHLVDSLPIIYFKLGETEKAEKMLAAYYDGVKDDYFALYRLAAIYGDNGVKVDDALKWAQRSNEMSKGEKFYVLDTLAGLHFRKGEYAKAVEFGEKALALAPRPEVKKEFTEKLEKYRKALKK
jgi:YHS domain-containing protein/Tfp pilus assembly protein PilF